MKKYQIECNEEQLWLDRPEDKKSPITVDASEAMRFGSSVLAKINRINNNK
jgi:hypothetical protein